MKWLLDNSVFFPLVNSAHSDHAAVTAWHLKERHHGWAVTPETYLGTVRKLMNHAIMNGRELKARDAIKVVRAAINATPKGKILIGAEPDDPLYEKAQGHRQIMDLYLIQTARDNNLKLVTRDKPLLTAFPKIATPPI